jgi:hypothetical protein
MRKFEVDNGSMSIADAMPFSKIEEAHANSGLRTAGTLTLSLPDCPQTGAQNIDDLQHHFFIMQKILVKIGSAHRNYSGAEGRFTSVYYNAVSRSLRWKLLNSCAEHIEFHKRRVFLDAVIF